MAGVVVFGVIGTLFAWLRVRGRMRRTVERTGDAQTWAAAGGARYQRIPSWRGRARRRGA